MTRPFTFCLALATLCTATISPGHAQSGTALPHRSDVELQKLDVVIDFVRNFPLTMGL